jgi:hypothetical protein
MNSSKNGLRRGLQTCAVGAATAIAVGFLSAGAANADTNAALPGGTITKTLADGTVVTVTMSGESANISGSMGSTPLHRNVWVSGSAKVEISGGSGAEGGELRGPRPRVRRRLRRRVALRRALLRGLHRQRHLGRLHHERRGLRRLRAGPLLRQRHR